MQIKNLVFIGAGAVFTFHYQDWLDGFGIQDKFFVVDPFATTVADPRAQLVSLEEAVELADFVVVNTPSWVRQSVAAPFIERDIPIAIEKPVALSWEDMEYFAKQTNKWILPILNNQMSPEIQNVLAHASASSTWNYFFCSKYRSRPKSYYEGTWHGKYRTDGGVLAQQGFHCLDLICSIDKSVEKISALGWKEKHNIECEDSAHVRVYFTDKTFGEVACSTAASTNSASLELVTSSRRYHLTAPNFVRNYSGHLELAKAAAHALANNLPPPLSLERALTTVQALHAAYVSMDNSGKEIPFGTRHPLLGIGETNAN